ncbi:bacitracin ABC transporter permease [Paenibacillus polymyxa]|uniref:ABC transporter permease n=1 Tax=Paenibacillus TaxID=44249 RepID=UPI0005CF7A35|nr:MULTISPECIES: ABC transporter permease [Paenibacillus]KJD39556.1 bacitracin ABC transporter permease [Paenibacillus polymyxa]QDA27028.1 ABC transporter permease [Paenibacillus polymyxa]RFT99588.1 ABC transporter permease [Paenibacillus jamilae]RTZ35075.1 ABC transporter permease [Paenibacillus polymyxa]
MNINLLILKNLKKNLKNYYLYVFALIFSVALYFAFVTLQYDPSMDEVKGSVKGAASIRAASVLLVAIVCIFLLYANNIFIKRRSKEIGLFQLIGMTKSKIFRILSAENLILYFGSLFVGIGVGFSFSKLVIMILFKTTGVEAIATLYFSNQALTQTLIVFVVIYLLIMVMNYSFIKRQSILSLFRVTSTTEGKIKKITIFEMIIGIIGVSLIALGYYVSSRLFGGDFTSLNELFMAMVFILGSVIIGTFLFYKGSIRFISNIIRKSKGGYLNIHEVLSLSSIMFRMKSNALLLTIITTVSALAIGLLSLSYIAYYSADQAAEDNVPSHFAMTNVPDAEKFKALLHAHDIQYREKKIEVIQVSVKTAQIMETPMEQLNKGADFTTLPVVSDRSVEDTDVSPGQTVLTGYNDMLQKFMSLKDFGPLDLKGKTEVIPQQYVGLKKDYVIPYYFAAGGVPTVIVDETIFERLKKDVNPEIQKKSSLYIGIDMLNSAQIEEADRLFAAANFNDQQTSQLEMSSNQKRNMGVIMFVVGFLGLTFLITSGCILYFKQMDESEDEKANYTVLRKLGFTQSDLLRGIKIKQLFNFGIPLVIGLSHSYFAVQSGWFLFGTEVWMPMIIVMVLYTALYSIFGVLSILYYKKVIKSAL